MANFCSECGHTFSSDETLIVLVLDESGSMSSNRTAVISAVNEFIDDQKKKPGAASIMVNTFDSGWTNEKKTVRTILEETPLSEANHITEDHYNPAGGTPLYDAFGVTISQVKKIANGRKVLFVVNTDGGENTSQEHSLTSVQGLMKGLDWQFVFMGADIDAWGEALNIGGTRLSNSSWQYTNTANGIAEAFTSLSSNTATYRASSARSVDHFFNQDSNTSIVDSATITTTTDNSSSDTITSI